MTKMCSTHKCNVCGKKIYMFCPSEDWVYQLRWKGKPKYYCSWTCYRKMERGWERQKHENMKAAGMKGVETKRRKKLEQVRISDVS